MKHHPVAPILLLLFGLAAATPAAFAQSLPASMAYSSPILALNMPVESGQKLLIAGNSLTRDHRPAFDLSEIPASPESVARDSKIPSTAVKADADAEAVKASTSKLRRSGVLLGILAIAYLATRKRRNTQPETDASESRDFPKKRLAHR